jgi:hypothetical protein
MVKWQDGTKAHWYNVMVRWYMAQWEDGLMAPCLDGKFDGTMA